MKIVIINTNDWEGGAAKAAFRLHQALNLNNINSKMLVLEKKTDYKDIVKIGSGKFDKIIASNLKKIPNKILLETLYKTHENFSIGKAGINILNNKIIKEADIIHLNWINGNFINISQLHYLNKPIVWTLHDMWPFTGGCHHARKCVNYKSKCHNCFQLNSSLPYDLSTNIFNTKLRNYNNKMVIVGCSKWITECAKDSTLFKNNRVITIPNTLNTNIFKPIDKKLAKNLLNIDKNKFIISFGVNNIKDKRKGFEYFKQVIKMIKHKGVIENLEVLIFGSNFEDGGG